MWHGGQRSEGRCEGGREIEGDRSYLVRGGGGGGGRAVTRQKANTRRAGADAGP